MILNRHLHQLAVKNACNHDELVKKKKRLHSIVGPSNLQDKERIKTFIISTIPSKHRMFIVGDGCSMARDSFGRNF